MCLTLTLAGPDFGLLATDRYMYTHRDGEYLGRRDLGRAKLGRFGTTGWVTGGGDGRFVLGALQELTGADPNDTDAVGSIVHTVGARHPDAEGSRLDAAWWDGTGFRGGTYAADGTFNPTGPGAPRIGWPGSPNPAVMDRVGAQFIQNAQNALQGADPASGLAEAVGALFLAASRASQWVHRDAEGVLMVPDGTGGCRTFPLSTKPETSYVA